ncbi:hypothetical protein [Synechococcus sp. MIT S1220]
MSFKSPMGRREALPGSRGCTAAAGWPASTLLPRYGDHSRHRLA